MLKIFYLLLCFSLLACSQSNKKSKNHLNIPLQSSVSSLDPAVCYDQICRHAIAQSYEPLFEYEYKTRPYKLKPLLAISMPEVSSDGLVYTFKIKKSVYYQAHNVFKNNPKREVIADDFIMQIKRVAFQSTQSRGWWLFDKQIEGLNSFRQKAKTINDLISLRVEGLRVIDKHTFQVKLVKPNAQFIYAFAMDFTAPIPFEAIKEYNNDLNRHTAATGPFILQKWIPNSKIEYIKNSGYRVAYYPGTKERIPYLDSFTAQIIKEAPTRWLNFSKGKIDFLELDKDDHQLAIGLDGKLKKNLIDQGIERHLSNSLTYWWLGFNMNHQLLGQNKNLRAAISHAINRDKFISLFTSDLGLKASSIYPPGILGHSKNNDWPIQYDIEKAKQLLKEAGFPEGKGLPEFDFDLRSTDSKRRQMGDFYQGQLAKIGVKINIIPNTFPSYLKKAREGKLELFMDGWIMDYPDPENALQLLYSKNKTPGPNVTSFQNNEFDKTFLMYKSSTDQEEKIVLLSKLETIIKQELPWHMMFYSRYNTLVHSRVKNYQYSDVISNFLKYLKIAP